MTGVSCLSACAGGGPSFTAKHKSMLAAIQEKAFVWHTEFCGEKTFWSMLVNGFSRGSRFLVVPSN